jgi:hypothetical protein
MNTSRKISDSITITDNFMYSENGTIAVLLQESIRFEKFKRFAVYKNQEYIGNYECCAKVKIKYSEITETMCKMIFGKAKKYAHEQIKQLYKKGRFSLNAEYCFIVLFKIGFTEEYKIKRQDARF